ncbi:SRPBCC family protein [Sungkyunkwania multivorans]|uniref:SRPBCC family protein n=1 Tax=Sungkyunkwania multivorans TaxID=1173618 RepID=A0ABW3CTX0_9FLAO
MKYQNEVVIDKPLEEVISKMDSAENMKYWQKGLISYEHIHGTPGEVGAKMRLTYTMGNSEMAMTETIVKRNFPKEFHATYEAAGVWNMQHNYFSEVDATTTKWISKSEFKFSTFKMKFFGFIMPGAFKKQSRKYMEAFKDFVEQGISVADE